jgi:restriction system protein
LQEFWWQTLDGRRFEVELALVLKRLGYNVRWTGRAGDGGVDLELSRGGHEVIVQCKAHKNPIGPGPVRDLYGTMIHRKANEAWLVTANGFSQAARDFAHGKGIRLLRVRELLKADRPFDS